MTKILDSNFMIQAAILEGDLEALEELLPLGCVVANLDKLLVKAALSPTADEDLLDYLVNLAAYSTNIYTLADSIVAAYFAAGYAEEPDQAQVEELFDYLSITQPTERQAEAFVDAIAKANYPGVIEMLRQLVERVSRGEVKVGCEMSAVLIVSLFRMDILEDPDIFLLTLANSLVDLEKLAMRDMAMMLEEILESGDDGNREGTEDDDSSDNNDSDKH